MTATTCEFLVVGGGNAALCASLVARELHVEVLMLERAPKDERGGNSALAAGGGTVNGADREAGR